MNKQIFYVTCLYPTQNITSGKNYDVITEDDNRITIINNKGVSSSLMRFRFGELQVREEKVESEMQDKLTCTDGIKFKNLTTDKVYEIIDEKGNFYTVVNDKNVNAKYGKKYFKVIKVAKVEKEVVEDKATCIFPISGELTFAKEYSYTIVDDKIISVSNDLGNDKTYISKRFKINSDV